MVDGYPSEAGELLKKIVSHYVDVETMELKENLNFDDFVKKVQNDFLEAKEKIHLNAYPSFISYIYYVEYVYGEIFLSFLNNEENTRGVIYL